MLVYFRKIASNTRTVLGAPSIDLREICHADTEIVDASDIKYTLHFKVMLLHDSNNEEGVRCKEVGHLHKLIY